MKDKELVKRISNGPAPDKIYEVYDSTDSMHQILIYSGLSRDDAVVAAKKYHAKYHVPFECIQLYELVKQ